MKKTFILTTVLLGLVLCGDAKAQLLYYAFSGGTEGEAASPAFSDANITASGFTRNDPAEIKYTEDGNPGGAIWGDGWTGSDTSNGQYWEFSLSPLFGTKLELASLSFDYRSTSTGPTQYEISINGLLSSSGNFDNNGDFHGLNLPITGFSSLDSAEVRIHAYGASTAGGTLRMDNVILDGLALTPVPEPSTWVLLSGGLVFLASRFRRKK